MKKATYAFLALLALAVAPISAQAQQLVFNSFDLGAGFVAFGAANGVIGAEDYQMDVSGLGSGASGGFVEMTSFQFVGGVTGSTDGGGGVINFDWLDATGTTSFANFDVNLTTEGAFIWTITASAVLPTDGILVMTIDDANATNAGRDVVGQWFIQTETAVTNAIGTSTGNPFGLPADGLDPRVFSFNVAATGVPEPGTLGVLAVAALGFIGRRRRA